MPWNYYSCLHYDFQSEIRDLRFNKWCILILLKRLKQREQNRTEQPKLCLVPSTFSMLPQFLQVNFKPESNISILSFSYNQRTERCSVQSHPVEHFKTKHTSLYIHARTHILHLRNKGSEPPTMFPTRILRSHLPPLDGKRNENFH